MEDKRPPDERRTFRRVDKQISLKLSLNKKGDILTETRNISAKGAFCHIAKPIGMFSKLKLTLMVPLKKGGNGKTQTTKLACEGVVVRENPSPDGKGYLVAIFFSNISNLAVEKLSQYVDYHLS
ncbi:MAG: PilZ domain-containing protein [Candidatus Gygaella obscura]|nr:PilZ domain-containing protein [Candidatus Gygaella obscura]